MLKYLSHVPTCRPDIFKREIILFSKLFFFGFVVVVLGIFAINLVVCLSDVFAVTKCFRIVVILFSELAFYLTYSVSCRSARGQCFTCRFYI